MSSCIHHTVFRIPVRQIAALTTGIKRKLQHLHARKSGLFQHRRRQKAQILRNDRKLAKAFLHRLKQLIARALFPVAKFSGPVLCRDRIIGIKSTEMIYAHNIIQTEAVLHAGQPPCVIRCLMMLPPVKRISPQLAGRGKGIRRTSGNCLRLSGFIKLEQLRMSPAVCTVHGDIDRDITDDPYAAPVCIMLELCPLLLKLILQKFIEQDFLPAGFLVSLHRLRPSGTDILIP